MAYANDLLADRYGFLAAVSIVNPSVIESLRDNVAIWLNDSPSSREKRLAEWAKEFRLEDWWIVTCAYETILKLQNQFRHTGAWPDPARVFLSSFSEGEREYRVRWIRSKLRRLDSQQPINDLLEELREVAEEAEEIGETSVGTSIFMRAYKFPLGFVALAMFQTMGMSPREILQELEKPNSHFRIESGEKGICVAYQRAAKSIGLTLREGQRGPRRAGASRYPSSAST